MMAVPEKNRDLGRKEGVCWNVFEMMERWKTWSFSAFEIVGLRGDGIEGLHVTYASGSTLFLKSRSAISREASLKLSWKVRRTSVKRVRSCLLTIS